MLGGEILNKSVLLHEYEIKKNIRHGQVLKKCLQCDFEKWMYLSYEYIWSIKIHTYNAFHPLVMA